MFCCFFNCVELSLFICTLYIFLHYTTLFPPQLVSLSREGNLTDICNNDRTLDGLQLRFSLVGGVFEAFQRSAAATTDWALLLVQLVTHSLVDLHTHSELFTTVVDMLATLVHSALASDSQDEGRKMYQNLMKKLKKEVGERQSASLQHVRQLLPLPRVVSEVIAIEPTGWVTDSKGNKISFMNIDKKHGLQVSKVFIFKFLRYLFFFSCFCFKGVR